MKDGMCAGACCSGALLRCAIPLVLRLPLTKPSPLHNSPPPRQMQVCLYEEALQQGALPAQLPSFLMASLPFDVTSFALSLLLVFR